MISEGESNLVLTREEYLALDTCIERLSVQYTNLMDAYGTGGRAWWADSTTLLREAKKVITEMATLRAIVTKARRDNANLFRDPALLALPTEPAREE